MPVNLTDVDSFDTATGPSGTDVRSAASVRDALQPLANRTRHLYNRILPVADFTALRAVVTAGMATGQTRVVVDQGLYTFSDTSSAPPVEPFCIRPTDRSSSNGRWLTATAHRTARTIRFRPGHLCNGEMLNVSGTNLQELLPSAAAGVPMSPAVTIGKRNLGAFEIALKSASDRHWFSMPLALPDNVSVNAVKARLVPASVGTLPVNMPFIGLVLVTFTAGFDRGFSALNTGVQLDTSANTGLYNAEHDITLTPNAGLGPTDHSAGSYELIIGAAGGANAVLGDVWKWVDVDLTVYDSRGG